MEGGLCPENESPGAAGSSTATAATGTSAALIAGTSGQKSVQTLAKTTRSNADMRALL